MKLRPQSYEEMLQLMPKGVPGTLEYNPDNFNFSFDVLEKIAAETPDRLCIRHVDDAGVRRDFSFQDVDKAASRLANAMKARGIGKGDRVMVVLYRRMEFWYALLGLHKLGAVIIPAPSQLTPKDIAFRVNKAGTKAMIVDASMTARLLEAMPECPSLKVVVQADCPETSQDTSGSENDANGSSEAGKLPAGWFDYTAITDQAPDVFEQPSQESGGLAQGKDPLLIFFSSGTTGMPKMVEHTHSYPLGHAFTGIYWHDLEPGDIHLTVADTGWGKAVWGKAYGQWMGGAAVFVYDFRGKFDPEALLKVVAEHGVTTFCAPPTVYRFLVRQDLSAYDLSKLRHCTAAGELLNESVYHGWEKATGLPIYEGFGQTETTLQIATLPFMKPKAGSIGRPVPGWDVRLLDDEGNECPPGEEGEICVGLPKAGEVLCGLFTDYVDEPEKTKIAVHDGFYHTGDKAWMDEDGYFWFLGRVDDLIKSSGYRIGPFEVESALVSHPAVIEAAVTGVPDPLRGQIVKATIVLSEGHKAGPELSKTLQEHVKTITAPYKYPRIIEYVDELPKTISGKIKRAEIREKDYSENE